MDYSFDGTGGYKVSTGIAGLDVQLGGGVPPGTTILLLAEPGAGSEIFAQQFAYGGLLNNEDVFYVSSEQPIPEVVAEMKSFGWDVKNYVGNKLSFVDEYSPRYSHSSQNETSYKLSPRDFLKQGGDSLNVLKATILEEHEGKYRGIIDSISYFLRKYDISQVIGAIDIMSAVGKITGAVHLVLMTSGMHDPYMENTMKHECDGVIEFRMRERGSEIERSILIRKMRGMIAPDRTISYSITRKGIELETTTRVL